MNTLPAFSLNDYRPNQAGLPIQGIKKTHTSEQIAKVTQEYESVFLAQMLEHLFADVELDPFSTDAEGSDIYKSWMLEAMAKDVAAAGGIGIARDMHDVLLKQQEIAHDP